MKLASVRCYASFFTPERFYAIGCRSEAIKDNDITHNLIVKLSQYIQQRQLPFKYCCYFVSFRFRGEA